MPISTTKLNRLVFKFIGPYPPKDEATSALDSLTEMKIQTAVFELIKHKTALVIAHRLSTILNMDRIVVLEKGKIIEQGTHQQLLAKQRKYYAMWQHQSGDFLAK